MIFLTLADLNVYIKSNVLADILQTTPTILNASGSTLLTSTEKICIESIKSYIGHYYDIDSEIKLTGSNRSGMLISFLIDMVLYEINARLTPTQIPEIRKERYNEICKKLANISLGKTPAPWMKLELNSEPTSAIRVGGNTPMNHYF